MVDALTVLKQRATADDPTALFTLVSDLGKVGKKGEGAGEGGEGRVSIPHSAYDNTSACLCIPT